MDQLFQLSRSWRLPVLRSNGWGKCIGPTWGRRGRGRRWAALAERAGSRAFFELAEAYTGSNAWSPPWRLLPDGDFSFSRT